MQPSVFWERALLRDFAEECHDMGVDYCCKECEKDE